jgi:peptidoglycan/LPS O-acetylase OafA/YrhL
VERELGEERHQPALDGVRGVAIAAVLVCHFSTLLPAGDGPPLAAVLSYGWAGVDLFFALSGFLITRILLRTKGRPHYLRSFWARRALRIMPLYFVVLSVVLIAGGAVPALSAVLPPAADRPLYVLFLSNWASLRHGWDANMLGHLWSLAVEEQFYLIWPFCVVCLSRRGLAILAATLALGALLLRVRYVVAFGPADLLSLLTVTRADGLALGAFAAVLLSQGATRVRVRAACGVALLSLTIFCAGIAACWSHQPEFFQTAGFSLLALAFAAVVFAVAATRSRPWPMRALETRPLVKLGTYSYGMYLLHVPLLETYRRVVLVRLPPFWHVNLAAVVASIGALWALTYYLAKFSFERFEAPILRLKRYVRVPNPDSAIEAAVAKPSEVASRAGA